MYTFIFDIGKTNIKAHVLDVEGKPVWSKSCVNTICHSGLYPHIDIDSIWDWLCGALSQAATAYKLSAINVSTHGACAVLLGNNSDPVLPVLDYEFDGLTVEGEDYEEVRPPFCLTQSPSLGAGLNLGRQLWWLKHTYPKEFASIEKVLMYPQYWVYRLTGIAVTELTSMGCHTDLWEPENSCFSSLVDSLGLRDAIPVTVKGYQRVGPVAADLVDALGLPKDCSVYAGVHDSNASFARYLNSKVGEQFCVVSTGTWIVTMSSGHTASNLDENKDMLANVNVLGQPISCARFMGGREFEWIIQQCGETLGQDISLGGVQAVIDMDVMAIPPFVEGSGPFKCNSKAGYITSTHGNGATLATLYLALMIDYQLDLLGEHGDVLLGSTSIKNPVLCQLLSQLRPNQKILMSNDPASTIRGAWCLTRWQDAVPGSFNDFVEASPSDIVGLQSYRNAWRALAGS